MDDFISKELLLELKLFDNIENREWKYEINGNTLRVIYNITNCFSGNVFNINIYELSHKCKEWAHGKDYKVSSYLFYHAEDKITKGYSKVNNKYCFPDNTEPEAIFKACEWIRKELLK